MRALFLSALALLLAACTAAEAPEKARVDCRINEGPCTARTSGGEEAGLSITPRPVAPMKPLVFRVEIGRQEAGEELYIELLMPGMYMGENLVPLEPAPAAEGEDLYLGRGIIPRCPSGGSVWRAVLRDSDHRELAEWTFKLRETE